MSAPNISEQWILVCYDFDCVDRAIGPFPSYESALKYQQGRPTSERWDLVPLEEVSNE